jgi:hypothetical protein
MRNQAGKQGAMPATATPTDTTTRDARSDQYARLVALRNDNVDALVRLHAILRDGALEWTSDLLGFAGRHFQRQSNGASWQISAANPLETAASHLRNCQEFAEECLDQTAKLMTLTTRVSRDSREHLESHAAAMLSSLGRDESFRFERASLTSSATPTDGRADNEQRAG